LDKVLIVNEPAHARLSADDQLCGAPAARITMIR
jgi:hypothetical protein